MSIGGQREYRLTQSKLAGVREMMAKIRRQPPTSPAARAASLRSLNAYANQLIEELVEYEISQVITPLTSHHVRASTAAKP